MTVYMYICIYVYMYIYMYIYIYVTAETIRFAIQLRKGCLYSIDSDELNSHVYSVLDALHLHEVSDTKAIDLSSGQRRMLSLAEELTDDPYLLFIDEPLRALSNRETSILMTCLRELVNEDRTIVATIFEVSASCIQRI